MSDFESLKSGPSFAGSLLRSAADDAPSAHVRRLAASSLGLGLGMAATTSVVPSALAAGQTLGATTQVVAPAGVKSIGALAVSKWLASSFVVGVIASSSVITVHEVVTSPEARGPALQAQLNPPRASERTAGDPRRGPRLELPAFESQAPDHQTPPSEHQAIPPALQAPRVALPPSRARSSAASVSQAGASDPQTSSRPLASSQSTLTERTPAQASFPVAPETHAASLDEEIAWLEPARRWLKAKDGRQALAALDLAGPRVRLLASEAALLRVEALLLSGRRAEAESIAAPFLSRHPSSPHAQRLRRLLEQP